MEDSDVFNLDQSTMHLVQSSYFQVLTFSDPNVGM